MVDIRLDYGRMLDALNIEVDLFASHAEEVDAQTPIPSCPGLTAGETVRHVGSIFGMVAAWLKQGSRPQHWQRKPTPHQSSVDFLRQSFATLIVVLARHAPDDHCQTWYPAQQNYAFWARRMLHETVIHRVDLSSAAGARIRPVDHDIATDGIDEVLSLWFVHRLRQLGLTGHRRDSVLLRGTGPTAVSWLARVDREEIAATALLEDVQDMGKLDNMGHDATVTADVMNLYLWLWGRVPTRTDVIAVDGDDDAVAQLWALLRLATR